MKKFHALSVNGEIDNRTVRTTRKVVIEMIRSSREPTDACSVVKKALAMLELEGEITITSKRSKIIVGIVPVTLER